LSGKNSRLLGNVNFLENDVIVLELSTDNVLVIVGFVGVVINAFVAIWMRSVSLHNKISEQRSDALQKSNDELKKEIDELRDCVQDTRESYVTNERFDKVTDKIMGKLDEIMTLLNTKPDKGFCDIMHNRVGKIEK
jgi:Tfp pilus assembly protein PilN